jgi:TctA family transporter
MKNMNPGPSMFIENAHIMYAVFIIFIIANLLMLPLGWAAIKASRHILSVPRNILVPLILLMCIVGSFAITNSVNAVVIMLVGGLLGWLMEENGFPVAPVILGLVLGEMLESNFMTSMIKADGSLMGFFSRPIAATLGVMTIVTWVWMLAVQMKPKVLSDKPKRSQ